MGENTDELLLAYAERVVTANRELIEENGRLREELVKLRESRDAWRLQAMREHDEER
jgi:hypothetical protein